MKSIIFACVALGLLACCQGGGTPIWPLEWTSNFNETAYYNLNGINSSGQTNGIFYYDFGRARQRIDRDNGQFDRYCGTELPGVEAKCQMITVNNALWLVFPDQQKCCECCTNAQGCGVVSNSWLSRSEFKGTQTLGGYEVNVWFEQGFGENWYYDTTLGHFPVGIFMTGDLEMQFDPKTYTTASIDDSMFVLPGYCSGMCTNSPNCRS